MAANQSHRWHRPEDRDRCHEQHRALLGCRVSHRLRPSHFGVCDHPTVIVTNSDPGACSSFADTCSGDLIENTLDAAVTYKDNATGNLQTVTLKGTGLAVATLSFTPSSLTFTSTILGTTTAAHVITMKNTGTTTATFSAAAAITGTNATSFILSVLSVVTHALYPLLQRNPKHAN